jgi:hypothetical protein
MCALQMSAFGPKQTSVFATHMSARSGNSVIDQGDNAMPEPNLYSAKFRASAQICGFG